MIKVHLGCGKRNFGKDWFHVDGSTEHEHIKHHDIINLPFDKEAVSLIYASHVIEYFDRSEFSVVLKKWYSYLVPGGVLRLAVPNFKTMAELYIEKKEPLASFLGPLYGRMTMNNSFIYHKTVYDFNSLENVLTDTGFKNVHEYDWRATEPHNKFDDHSQAYIPHLDKENGVCISLNVECSK